MCRAISVFFLLHNQRANVCFVISITGKSITVWKVSIPNLKQIQYAMRDKMGWPLSNRADNSYEIGYTAFKLQLQL